MIPQFVMERQTELALVKRLLQMKRVRQKEQQMGKRKKQWIYSRKEH